MPPRGFSVDPLGSTLGGMDLVCQSCGAPAKPNLVECEFCEKPISAEAAAKAVGCPQCKTLNAGGQQQCHKCKAWLVVQCVFCSHLSPHSSPACLQCNEPFAGALERKAQRDSSQRNQQIFQTVGMVAPAAVGLLGGVAGALLGDRVAHSGGLSGNPSYGGYGPGYGPPNPNYGGQGGYGQGYGQTGYGQGGHPNHVQSEYRNEFGQGGTDNFHRTHDAQTFGNSYEDEGGRSRGHGSSSSDDDGGRSRGSSSFSSDDDDSGGRSRGSSSFSSDDDDSGGRSRGSSSDDDDSGRADDDGGRSRGDDDE